MDECFTRENARLAQFGGGGETLRGPNCSIVGEV